MIDLFYKTMYSTGTAPDNLSSLKIPDYSDERGCSETKLQKAINVESEETADGSQGVDSSQGVDGSQGVDSSQGVDRSQGVDSSQGADRSQGVDGSQGVDDVRKTEKDELVPPFEDTYIGTNSELFKDFKNNVEKMREKTREDSSIVLAKLSTLFDLSKNPIELQENLNQETIAKELDETRSLIINLYYNCEVNFQKGLDIFRNIVYQQLTQQTTQEIVNLGILQEKVLQK
jgi:hypothetical protein